MEVKRMSWAAEISHSEMYRSRSEISWVSAERDRQTRWISQQSETNDQRVHLTMLRFPITRAMPKARPTEKPQSVSRSHQSQSEEIANQGLANHSLAATRNACETHGSSNQVCRIKRAVVSGDNGLT